MMVLKEELSNVTSQLAGIVGSENVSDDAQALDVYSKDESFVTPRKPRAVVKPKSADEAQAIVKWANQTNTPLIPISSGPPHFRGDTVPTVGEAVIVDLSRMKKIIRIDRRNRMVLVESGVTWTELQPALAKEGMTVPMPLLPRINKSVVGSMLEREPITIPKYHWTMLEPLRCVEVIWGNGEKSMTGDAGDQPDAIETQWTKFHYQINPHGPYQTDFYRIISGAQGSMGIATWASLRCGVLPQVHKMSFIQSEKLENLIDFAYRLLRLRFGYELFILNGAYLASILGEDANRVSAIKGKLPNWILVVGIAGLDRLPKEKVEYQEKDISDIAQQFALKLTPAVPEASNQQLLDTLTGFSGEPYWKLRYKGSFQDILFISTLDKTPDFVKAVYSLSQQYAYPASDIGIYLQPVVQGVSCHCEFTLPYNPNNSDEVAKVKKFVTEGSEALMKQEAFFSRPYGTWAAAQYSRDSDNTIALKKIKGIFDPNNVMNPGKLCF